MKDFERGDIAKVDWLDRMAFRQIEAVHAVSPLQLVDVYADCMCPGRGGKVGQAIPLR